MESERDNEIQKYLISDLVKICSDYLEYDYRKQIIHEDDMEEFFILSAHSKSLPKHVFITTNEYYKIFGNN